MFRQSTMSTDADSNEDTKSTSLLADVTDDSCRLQYPCMEIVPLTRDADGPSTTDCDNGDWSAQVKQETLTVVKQEPQDGDVINASCCTTNDAEYDEVDETQSRMQPANVLGRLNLTRWQKDYNMDINTGSCSNDESSTDDNRTEHQEKKFFCPDCDKRFTTKANLTQHSRQHTGELLYSCSQCGKRCLSQSAIRAHMNTHTDTYKCTECGKCCINRVVLERHQRLHSGEKPFECYVCNRRFATMGNLSAHSRVHSGVKTCICRVCGKAFGQSSDLNRHMRIHTGDKPYKCSLCDKSFSDSGSLPRHKRKVHGNA